ncbi:MAG: flagellar basal body-associated FliL family protein [bacterium]|jgi:flagellar basal body-associated protein FliL
MLKRIKEMPPLKLVIATVLVMLLSATSIYGILAARSARNNTAGKPKNTVIVTIGDFTTNLALDELMRQSIVKVSIDLEVENQKAATLATKKLSQIWDTVLSEMRDMTLLELNGADGMDKLRQNLINAVNKQIMPFELIDLYFVDMVVQ